MEKTRANRLLRVLTLAVIMVAAASCANYKDIRINSCRIDSISPRGFTSVDAVLDLDVYNPTVGFTVSDIEGAVLYRQADTAAVFTGGPLTVQKKSEMTYEVPCSVSLGRSMSLLKLAALVSSGDFADYSVNMQMKITLKGGASRTIQFDNLKLDDLLNNVQSI